VETHLKAIASIHGFLELLDVGEGYWGGRTVPAQPGGKSVSTVTVNDIYRGNGQEFFPFIVKIDIEGGEKELFTQNLEWVAQTPLIIIELSAVTAQSGNIGLFFTLYFIT
jgi:hypothetical protein